MTRSSLLPITNWLRQYQPKWLSQDLISGLTLAAYAIPVSLAYAALAGVPPQMGLYCYLVAGLGYAVLGTSRHLAIGPTSAISLLLGVTLAEIAAGDLEKQASLASLTATRLNRIVERLPSPVRSFVAQEFAVPIRKSTDNVLKRTERRSELGKLIVA